VGKTWELSWRCAPGLELSIGNRHCALKHTRRRGRMRRGFKPLACEAEEHWGRRARIRAKSSSFVDLLSMKRPNLSAKRCGES
jgi:hypothetical protein